MSVFRQTVDNIAVRDAAGNHVTTRLNTDVPRTPSGVGRYEDPAIVLLSARTIELARIYKVVATGV